LYLSAKSRVDAGASLEPETVVAAADTRRRRPVAMVMFVRRVSIGIRPLTKQLEEHVDDWKSIACTFLSIQ
jgi:hypothetical protein